MKNSILLLSAVFIVGFCSDTYAQAYDTGSVYRSAGGYRRVGASYNDPVNDPAKKQTPPTTVEPAAMPERATTPVADAPPPKMGPGNNDNNLRLYPVNASKYVNIYFDAKKPKDLTLYILDNNNTVLQQWKEGARASYEKSVDVTNLPNGKYYIKATFNGGMLRQSFNVMH